MKPICLLVLFMLPCSAAAQSSCGGQTQLDASFCNKELSGGGSAAPMFYWTCMKEQTVAQIQLLQA